MTARALVIGCAAATLVAACAGSPAYRPGAEFEARSEKSMFVALKQVHATDEQRIAVMSAYDESQPRLGALNDQAAEVMGKWRELDRRDPNFTKKSNDLADRWGKLSKERMQLTGKFDNQVAGILKADQWDAWENFWMRPAFSAMEDETPRRRR